VAQVKEKRKKGVIGILPLLPSREGVSQTFFQLYKTQSEKI
jgi:hypothetical protein